MQLEVNSGNQVTSGTRLVNPENNDYSSKFEYSHMFKDDESITDNRNNSNRNHYDGNHYNGDNSESAAGPTDNAKGMRET